MKTAALLLVIVASALGQQWQVWNKDLGLTTSLGVAFTTENNGYIAGSANGAGDEIFKTEDGGNNFKTCTANFGEAAILLDMAANDKTAVVSGLFGEVYSIDDGATFKPSIGGGHAQNVEAFGSTGQDYGLAGQFKFQTINGVAISNDGGVSFRAMNAGLDTAHPARYAAFPSKDTIYCAAGTFPTQPPPPPPPPAGAKGLYQLHQTKRPRTSEFQDANGRFTTAPQPVGNGTYTAMITKSTDGGKSWSTMFKQDNAFYFNGIDCTSVDHCCAVGEASAGPANGARIFCTENGGKSWNRTFWAPGTGSERFSLMKIQFVSKTEGWAVGGDLRAIAPSAWFLHTTDAGATWVQSKHELFGYYALAVDMVSPSVGYAAVDNLITQQSALAKFSSGTPPSPSPSPPPPPGPSPPPPPSPGPSPPPAPGSGHYEDPNPSGTCHSDESAVQITGLQGSFCSPSCSSSSPCPTDAPAGTTAKPQCVLEKQGSSQPSQCALICSPSSGGCPPKASCKAIQGTGICTYDS